MSYNMKRSNVRYNHKNKKEEPKQKLRAKDLFKPTASASEILHSSRGWGELSINAKKVESPAPAQDSSQTNTNDEPRQQVKSIQFKPQPIAPTSHTASESRTSEARANCIVASTSHPTSRPTPRPQSSRNTCNGQKSKPTSVNTLSDNTYTSKGEIKSNTKQFPPPSQIKMNINTLQISKWVNDHAAASDFGQIDRLFRCLRVIARSIIQQRSDIQYIDEQLVRTIEHIKVKKQNNLEDLFKRLMLPTTERKLSPDVWSLCYRSMLSSILLIHPEDLTQPQIPLTRETFELFTNTYTYFRISEFALRRDKLQEEYNQKIQADIDDLNPKSPSYDEDVKQIKAHYGIILHDKSTELKDEGVWKYVDGFRDYFESHPLDDLSDFKTRMIWMIITQNPFICGLPQEIVDIIKDPYLFFIDYVNNYDIDGGNHWSVYHKLGDYFYDKYQEFTCEKCTLTQFNEWLLINMLRQILVNVVTFYNSNSTINDVINFDNILFELMLTFELNFDYNKNLSENMQKKHQELKYRKLNLCDFTFKLEDVAIDKHGNYYYENVHVPFNEYNLRQDLNKLSTRTYDVVSNIMMNSNKYHIEDAIKCVVQEAAKMDKYHYEKARLVNDMVNKFDSKEIRTELHGLIDDNIKQANTCNNDQVQKNIWMFVSILFYMGLIGDDKNIVEFVGEHKVAGHSNRVMCLNGFISNRELNIDAYNVCSAEMRRILNDELLPGRKGFEKIQVIDLIDKIDKFNM